MHIIKKYQPKMRLISNCKDQKIIEFINYDDLIAWFCDKWYQDKEKLFKYQLVNSFKGMSKDTLPTEYSFIDMISRSKRLYIVRDEFGGVYSVKELHHDIKNKLIELGCKMFSYNHKLCYEFRRDPVPGTRCYRNFHFMRRPKTTQERRMSYEYYELTRKKRYGANLPNAWDDMVRSAMRNDNWKRYRKHQWK